MKASRKRTIIIGCLLLLGLAGVFIFTTYQKQAQLSPVMVFPAENSLGAKGPVVLVFPVEMEHASVESRLQILPETPGWTAWQGKTLSFFPANPWKAGEELLVKLLPGAKTTSGEVLSWEKRWKVPIRQAEVIYLHPSESPAQIWVSDPSAKDQRQLTDQAGGVFDYGVSLDGSQLAYSARNGKGGYDLWIMNRSGEKAAKLLDCGTDWCVEPAISPNGGQLAYSRYAGPSETGNPEVGGQITLLDLDASQAENIPDKTEWVGRKPGWSPDGQYLAFYDPAGGGIRLLNRETGEEILLSSVMGENGDWSMDGRYLLYLIPHLVGLPSSNQLASADLLERKIEGIMLESGVQLEFNSPHWSPGGEWIAISRRLTGGNFSGQIWIYSTKGFEPVEVATDATRHFAGPRWNPAGTSLVYQGTVSGSSSAKPEVLVWDTQNRESSLVSEDAFLPDWLP